MNSRKIRPLDKQISNSGPTFLPKTSFTASLIASKGSGKSTLLINMLINPQLLNNRFNEVYLISPTSSLDEKFNILKNTNVKTLNKPLINLLKSNNNNNSNQLFGNDNEISVDYELKMTDEDFISKPSIEFLDDLIKQQKFIINKYGKKNVNKILLIYDDCINDKIFRNRNFIGLIFNSRHYEISIIISSQTYFDVPKDIRLNASLVILYNTSNVKELKNIYDENSCGLSFDQFKILFEDFTEKRAFGFLVFNYLNNSEHRIQNCFEEFINLSKYKKI